MSEIENVLNKYRFADIPGIQQPINALVQNIPEIKFQACF